MQWYYQDETQGQTPFDENYIAALSSENRIKATTLVWNDTLSGWVPAAKVFPETYPGVALPPGGEATAQSQAPATVAKESSRVSTKSTITHEAVKIKNQDLRELVKDLASYISAKRFWMKFFGIILIISGVVSALTLVGLVFAWLPVWSGVLLLKAANAATMAEATGTVEPLEDALYRIGNFFKINGIFVMVMIVIYLILIVTFFVMGGLSLLDGVPTSSTMNPFGGAPSR